MTLATYTFLPWLRRGLSGRIETPAGPGASRAKLSASFSVASETARRDLTPVTVSLIGPGDVAGVQSQQIIRTEPQAGVSDFEPNYLAAIDFYDEDFPWRYSPVSPDAATHRLPPWIVLVVLKPEEFTRSGAGGQPLASFTLTAAAHRPDIFAVIDQEWAWAHVHVNAALSGTNSVPDLATLGATLAANPDVAYARLLSPRKLEPNCGYTAFLVPAFEVGRRAGLGETIADTDDGTVRSWQGAADEFPIYFEWTFRTGVDGDFESLVRALVPRDVDPRVGIRDLDIARPGFGVAAATNPPDNLVGLEGALLAPTTVRKGLVAGSDFAPQVAAVVNAPAAVRDQGAADPLVAPPIYGCWHAQVDQVNAAPDAGGWVNTLNLDPRYRAAAGIGARVIRDNQERYVRIAWEQIGDVLKANQKIRLAQLATKAASAAYAKSLVPLPQDRAVALTAPVFTKVLGSPTTLAALVKSSSLPRAAVSSALRTRLRPRGAVARRFLPAGDRINAMARVVDGIGGGGISAAPPRPPAGGATLQQTTQAVTGSEPPPPSLGTTPSGSGWTQYAWLIVIVIMAVIGLLFIAPILALIVALIGAFAIGILVSQSSPGPPAPPPPPPADPPDSVAAILSSAGLAAAGVAATPPRPAFAFASASTDATLPAGTAAAPVPMVPGDSMAAADMRRALIEFGDAVSVRVAPARAKPALDRALIHQKALAALEPHQAFAARFAPSLRIGGVDLRAYIDGRYSKTRPGATTQTLQEVMNYPDIKDAMYAPLEDISSEYFIPNLKLVPDNTISLLQTNQPFIEAYLAGLNHEFARELLWREYPTDQRGSYFRQFWDVSTYVDRQQRDPKTLAEYLKDIPPLHQWLVSSALGSHNQREAQGEQSRVVLIIRGNLLKRYPSTFIYAQKAIWGQGPRANRLTLSDETGELFASQPQSPSLRFPLYKARVAPDIYFIGFDLTLDEARGDPRLDETAAARAVVGDNLGWFFVLQEAVGEPRFGLDADAPIEPSADKWDNLAWADIDLGSGEAVDVGKPFLAQPAGVDPAGAQWGSNAADMAYILYQEPVMIAVHGRNMLKNLKPTA
jgi:hypothetical protein